MKRCLLSIVFAAVCVSGLRADLTLSSTTTLEGGMVAAGVAPVAPKVTTRIKGNKARTDVDLGDHSVTTLVDLTTKQVQILNHAQKTVQTVDPAAPPVTMPAALPTIETSVKPTGQSKEISGAACDEHAISIKMDMSTMVAPDMPPQAAAMLKDMRINVSGSAWIAKAGAGVAEYAAFQSAAAKLAATALSGAAGPAGGSGLPAGMERLITGFSEAPGIPYLSELMMGVEGDSQMAAIMKQMGEVKIITRVTSVSTETLAESIFAVPDGYTVVNRN